MKSLTCWEHAQTRAGEAEKPRSIQQKPMHRKRDKEVSQHSADAGIPQVRRSQEPSDEDEYSHNSGACMADHRAAVQERKRDVTRVLAANNDHSGGVEDLSGPRRGRVPQTRRQDSSGEQEIHEKRTKSFHEACRTRTHECSQRLERCMQHSADER